MNLKTFWLGRQMTPSAAALSSASPYWARRCRRSPSHVEGQGDESEDESARFFGRARQHRADARARAAAQARQQEDHIRALAEGLEPGQLFLGHGAAALGVAAGAQAAQELGLEVDLLRGGGGGEALGLGVDGDKAGAGQAALDDQLEDADAGVADAEDFDGRGSSGGAAGGFSLCGWCSWKGVLRFNRA